MVPQADPKEVPTEDTAKKCSVCEEAVLVTAEELDSGVCDACAEDELEHDDEDDGDLEGNDGD